MHSPTLWLKDQGRAGVMGAALAMAMSLTSGSGHAEWSQHAGVARSAPDPDGLRAWVRYDNRCKPELLVGRLSRQRTIRTLRGRVVAAVDGSPVAAGEQAMGRRVRLTESAVTSLRQGEDATITIGDRRLTVDLTGASAAIAGVRRDCRPLEPLPGHNGNHWVTVTGDIGDGWAQAVMDHIRAVGATGLVIESNGWNFAEAERLGRWLRRRGLDTAVTGDCASACAMAFAGGVLRFIAFGARVGLQGAALLGGGDRSETNRPDAMAAYTRYLKSLGIPRADTTADPAAASPSPASDWLDADAAIEIGLATELGTPHGVAAR